MPSSGASSRALCDELRITLWRGSGGRVDPALGGWERFEASRVRLAAAASATRKIFPRKHITAAGGPVRLRSRCGRDGKTSAKGARFFSHEAAVASLPQFARVPVQPHVVGDLRCARRGSLRATRLRVTDFGLYRRGHLEAARSSARHVVLRWHEKDVKGDDRLYARSTSAGVFAVSRICARALRPSAVQIAFTEKRSTRTVAASAGRPGRLKRAAPGLAHAPITHSVRTHERARLPREHALDAWPKSTLVPRQTGRPLLSTRSARARHNTSECAMRRPPCNSRQISSVAP